MLRILALALGVLWSAVPVAAVELTGAIRVVDGDTFDLGATRIRLHGIDALERGQSCFTTTGQNWSCGDWTTRQVRDRFEGARATCRKLTSDRYGRTVARCRVGGQDMARLLVRDGLAYAAPRYAPDYVADERRAARADLGIHGFSAQSPARYRLTRGRAEQVSGENGCRIKGNIARKGTRIYHLPGQAFYARTWVNPARGERWFCTEAQARASGWRRSKR